MKKGVIFTYDAMAAVAVAILLLSAIQLTRATSDNEGPVKNTLYNTATDKSLKEYLNAGFSNQADDRVSGKKGNCKEAYQYLRGKVVTKVKACQQLQ